MSSIRAIFEDPRTSNHAEVVGTMSEQEFVEWCTSETWAEWVDGKVILMSPVNFRHAEVAMFLAHLLRGFVDDAELGTVVTEPFQVRFGRLKRRRSPDIIFISNARLKQIETHHLEGPADLIVEVVSPESQSRDRREKYLEYEAAGVREYWIIDPDSRTAESYSLSKSRRFVPIEPQDHLIRSKVLQGFVLDPRWLWRERFPKVSTLLSQMKRKSRRK